MNPQVKKSQDYFTLLNLIYFSLVAGLIIFMAVVVILNSRQDPADFQPVGVFIYLVPVSSILAILASIYIPKFKLPEIESKKDLKEKLSYYQSLLIIKWALLEGGAIVALVSFMLTGYFMLGGFALLLILYLIFQKPTRYKLLQDINLTDEERNRIVDSNGIIDLS